MECVLWIICHKFNCIFSCIFETEWGGCGRNGGWNEGNIGNGSRNVGNQAGNAGNAGTQGGNGGGNVGNQGRNVRIWLRICRTQEIKVGMRKMERGCSEAG